MGYEVSREWVRVGLITSIIESTSITTKLVEGGGEAKISIKLSSTNKE